MHPILLAPELSATSRTVCIWIMVRLDYSPEEPASGAGSSKTARLGMIAGTPPRLLVTTPTFLALGIRPLTPAILGQSRERFLSPRIVFTRARSLRRARILPT